MFNNQPFLRLNDPVHPPLVTSRTQQKDSIHSGVQRDYYTVASLSSSSMTNNTASEIVNLLHQWR
jgi:hypothetical protein